MLKHFRDQGRYKTIFVVVIFLAILIFLTPWKSSSGLEFSVSILRQPDLLINNIYVSDPNPSFEDTVTVSVEISNQGSTSSASFNLDIFDNPSDPLPRPPGTRGGLGSKQVSSLGMGKTKVVDFKDVRWPFPSAPVHEIWGQIDIDDEINETDENNNIFGPTGVLIKPALVDLVVLSITPTEINPSIGDTVTVDVVVKNRGVGGVGAFDLDFFNGTFNSTPSVGDTGDQWSLVGGLAAGDQTTVSFETMWLAAGDRSLFAVVDTKQFIEETNENNNIYGPKNIFIGKPDLIVESISLSDINPLLGSSINVDVTVRNVGFKTASFDVDLFDQSVNEAPSILSSSPNSGFISNLSPGATTIVTFSLNNLQAEGTHYLYAMVDNSQAVAEEDESNNMSGPVSFYVYEPDFSKTEQWNSGGSNTWSWDASKVAKGYFDGDGITDIVVLYGYKTERDVKAFFFKGNSNGSFSSPRQWWQAGVGNWDFDGSKLTSGDYNGDGKWDLAILYGYKVERDVRAFVFTSNGNGFNNPAVWFHAGRNNWDWKGSILSVGDFDGNGSSDMAILYGYKAQRDVALFVFLSNGSSAFNGSSQWWRAGAGNWDWKGSKVTAGDYDGNGLDDIAIFYGYGGSQSAIFVFPSTGSGFNNASTWYNSGAGNLEFSDTKILSGDFDGSGADELAGFFNHGNSQAGIYVFR